MKMKSLKYLQMLTISSNFGILMYYNQPKLRHFHEVFQRDVEKKEWKEGIA